MAYETYPKNGKTGSRKVFSGESSKSGWNDGDREKRDYMKSGRNEGAGAAANSEKFKVGKESPGNTSRREYPKKGHSATKFGTTVSQGN